MWYVIQIKRGSEKDMCKKCRQALPMPVCSCVFVPKFRKVMKVKGVWKKEEEILFPGYLFVETKNAEEVEKYLEPLYGATKPVYIGGGFYPIRDEEEEFLRSIMNGNYVLNISKGYIVDGNLVVTKGPLVQYADHVKWFDRHKRIGELELALWGERKTVRVGLEVVARVTEEEFEIIKKKL